MAFSYYDCDYGVYEYGEQPSNMFESQIKRDELVTQQKVEYQIWCDANPEAAKLKQLLEISNCAQRIVSKMYEDMTFTKAYSAVGYHLWWWITKSANPVREFMVTEIELLTTNRGCGNKYFLTANGEQRLSSYITKLHEKWSSLKKTPAPAFSIIPGLTPKF